MFIQHWLALATYRRTSDDQNSCCNCSLEIQFSNNITGLVHCSIWPLKQCQCQYQCQQRIYTAQSNEASLYCAVCVQ